MSWHAKAHALIHQMCTASYLQANTKPDGTRQVRHRPYTVPPLAEELVRCLAREDEESAKAVFLQIATGMPRDYTGL